MHRRCRNARRQNMTTERKRESYWDIVRGLGMLCIVLAHCCPKGNVIAFLYLFHVPLFFFLSGVLFDEEKWQQQGLAAYIGSRFISVWPRFVLYSVLFLLLHNPMAKAGLLAGGLFDKTTMLVQGLNAALFGCVDNNAGALWFIAPWLLSSIAFGTTVLLAKKYLPEKAQVPAALAALAVMTAAGFFLNAKGIAVTYNAQTALVMTGTLAAGWLLRKYFPGFRKYLGFVSLLLSTAVLVILRRYFDVTMSLADRNIRFPAALIHIPAGIIMTMSAAELLAGVPKVRDAFAFLGRHSFDIMALHFLTFKLIDLVYITIKPEHAEAAAGFPVAFPKQLFPFYVILGLLLPALAGAGLDRVRKKIR